MEFDPAALPPKEMYKLLTSTWWSRLAGNLYTHVHDIFEMKRPNPDYRG